MEKEYIDKPDTRKYQFGTTPEGFRDQKRFYQIFHILSHSHDLTTCFLIVIRQQFKHFESSVLVHELVYATKCALCDLL